MSAGRGSPAEVHPEHDQPTPANVDEWTDDQLAEFNRRQEATLDDELADERGLSESEERARDALVAVAEEQVATETVALHEEVDHEPQQEIELEVRASLSGEAAETLEAIEPGMPAREAVPRLLDVIEEVVEGPEGYASRRVWHDVYRDSGLDVFMEYVEAITAPAEETLEAVSGFREDGPRAGGP